MSRNLGRTNCKFCDGKVGLVESPRRATDDDTGKWPGDVYHELTIAHAECEDCHGKYTAWIKLPSWKRDHLTDVEHPFFDLSFRSSFNDEPDPDDLYTVHPNAARAARMRLEASALEANTMPPLWETYRRVKPPIKIGRPGTLTIRETYGAHPSAELNIIDEGNKVRIRVREPNLGKASIFLTDVELGGLASAIKMIRESRRTPATLIAGLDGSASQSAECPICENGTPAIDRAEWSCGHWLISNKLAAYLKLEGLMMDLDDADDPAADVIRDLIDPLWHGLKDRERDYLNSRPPDAIRKGSARPDSL